MKRKCEIKGCKKDADVRLRRIGSQTMLQFCIEHYNYLKNWFEKEEKHVSGIVRGDIDEDDKIA